MGRLGAGLGLCAMAALLATEGRGGELAARGETGEGRGYDHGARSGDAGPTASLDARSSLSPGRGVPDTLRPRRGPLNDVERRLAAAAWAYLYNNFQPTTCLINSVENYPSTTMWDAASQMGGLISAYDLGLVTDRTLHVWLECQLATLGSLALYNGELPNKAYHAQTLAKVGYGNEPADIGFSAMDLGRLLIWLRIVSERFPEHAAAAEAVVSRWQVCNLIDACGTLYGARSGPDGRPEYVQEGRLGYEEYAARGYALWGFDVTAAAAVEPCDTAGAYGIEIPFDARDPRVYGAHTYVVTESHALDGIEFGWDQAGDGDADERRHTDAGAADRARRVFAVQRARYRETGVLTARSEHQLASEPYFVYDTVYSDGYFWNTITEDGRYVPEMAAISTKAAVSLFVLWDTRYTARLLDAVSTAFAPERGVYEGVYEQGYGPLSVLTLNNNGILLEALAYQVHGKRVPAGTRPRSVATQACTSVLPACGPEIPVAGEDVNRREGRAP